MPRRTEPTRPRTFGNVTVPGNLAGAIISVALILICWFAIPIARPFLLGTAVLGALFALILRWIHR